MRHSLGSRGNSLQDHTKLRLVIMRQRIKYYGLPLGFLCVAFMLWINPLAFCQSVNGTTIVNVARALEISCDVRPLAFGFITQGETKTLLPSNDGVQFLRYNILGERGFQFTISMPKTITMSGPGGATMLMTRKAVWMKRTTDFSPLANSYVPSPPPAAGMEDLYLDTDMGLTKVVTLIKENPADPPGGISRVHCWVGAEITASPTQTLGSYGGFYPVTVSNYTL